MADNPLVARAQDLAGEARVFHWAIAFPDVMAAGGFDVVLGNPPWERIKLQEQEFFAARDPEIAAAPNAAARGKLITALKSADPGSPERRLFGEFEFAKRTAEAASVFARENGRFPLTGRGDINTYALFAELFAGLTSGRGRAGVIVPTGIATDATTAPFFGALIDGRKLVQLLSFENEEFIFPNVHHSFRFCLLVIGPAEEFHEPEFAFFLRQPDQRHDSNRNFELSKADIARINPNTKTAPVFRSQADAELTAKIYTNVPVLIDESKGKAGNPWGVSFMRMFDMSNDSGLFRTAAQLTEAGYVRDGADWVAPEGLRPRQTPLDLAGGQDGRSLALSGGGAGRRPERYVPLYEAKMINFFDHRFGSYGARGDDRGYRVLPETTVEEHSDPAFEVEPFYFIRWIDLEERLPSSWRRPWLLPFKDITSATNERTAIFSLIPLVGVGHTAPVRFTSEDTSLSAVLLGCVNSIVVDYCARTKVGGLHLTYSYLKQFPVLPPFSYTPADLAFVVPRVLELTYTSHSMAPFARDLGYDGPPFAWEEKRRVRLRTELDAFYACKYGLSRDELRYILDPADVKGPDYPSETFRVLKKNEIAKCGEYRTARLVLAAYDRLVAGELGAAAAAAAE